MTEDATGAWEAIAKEFAAARSDVGSAVVRQWARLLPPGGEIVDIGCGSGVPVSLALADEGLAVFGVDASPTLLAMFQERFPHAQVACEVAQCSSFFGRQFDGAIAVGLMFLLSEPDQKKLIERVGQALRPGGRFLFSAPRRPCAWRDLQTGQPSLSLGEAGYRKLLHGARLHLMNMFVDEGGNDYFDAVRSER